MDCSSSLHPEFHCKTEFQSHELSFSCYLSILSPLCVHSYSLSYSSVAPYR
ncbi:hypothetical protein Hanom_Chr03g00180261 [Helianthus anomalus]